MRLNFDIKAYGLFAMFGILLPCANAAASSVEILVDAALEQSSLRSTKEVILQVVRAAGTENSVGVVVYDEVFQRSTDLSVADEAHLERISQIHDSVTPSEFSNIAVGIEKGISELNAEGGVLLVFGNSDILLADAGAVSKYTDWLELVLLPDAASKSISIILAVPQNAQSSSLNAIIQSYSDNKVITFRDASDAIDQLSLVLPFAFPADTQESPVAVLADQAVADRQIRLSEQAQGELSGESDSIALQQQLVTQEINQPLVSSPDLRIIVLLAVLVLVVLVAAAIAVFVRRRKGKTGQDSTDVVVVVPLVNEPLSRYLAPKQGNTIARPTRARETDSESTMLMPQPDTSQKFSGPDSPDEPIIAESEPVSDDVSSQLDATAPRIAARKNSQAQPLNADATAQRIAKSPEDALVSCETGIVDELEELRNITQLKHENQN